MAVLVEFMQLTEEQHQKIAPYFLKQQRNLQVADRPALNAILYMAENGCKWRGLSFRCGRGHSIYMRMSRWAKGGVFDRVVEHLKEEISSLTEALSLDRASVKGAS